jgi:integrase
VARPRAFSLELTKQEFGIAGPKKSKQDGLVETTVEEWLGYQKTQNSEYTHRSYRSITKKFLTFLAEGKVTRLRTVTREVVMKYRRWCLKQGNSKVTVDNNLIALRSFFNWCVSRGEISTNPIAQQRHGEHLFFGERTERKEAYTRDEFEKILRAASGDDHRAFLLLGSWGTRISELTMLEWADIDAEGGWVHIRNKRTHDGIRYRPKDKTDRKLPLEGRHVHEVLDQLAARTGRQGYLLPLPKVKSRRDYAGRRFLEQLKRLSKTTGIPATKLTLHRFRRYFVSECADRGVPMTTTMEWVGHDELKMVLYYYSLRDESAREAMRRLVGGAAPTAGGRSDRGHPAPQPSNHASGGHLKRSKSNRGRRRRIS